MSNIQNLELLSLNSDDVKSFTVGWETESIRVQINSETHRNRKDFYKSGLHSGQLVSTATSPCYVESASFPCACVGSAEVLWLFLTVQRHIRSVD